MYRLLPDGLPRCRVVRVGIGSGPNAEADRLRDRAVGYLCAAAIDAAACARREGIGTTVRRVCKAVVGADTIGRVSATRDRPAVVQTRPLQRTGAATTARMKSEALAPPDSWGNRSALRNEPVGDQPQFGL